MLKNSKSKVIAIVSITLVALIAGILSFYKLEYFKQTANPQPETSPKTDEAFILHLNLWRNTTKRAMTDRLYSHAIYASRILAVKNPEVYLKGDAIFLREITANNGYKRAYMIKNVTDSYFDLDEGLTGPPFSFSDVNFQTYKTSSYSEFYPEGYPFFSYLDRRMLTIASTLKTSNNIVSQLELAEQYYFKIKSDLGNSSKIFIIYCDDEKAYVYTNGSLISMDGISKKDSIDGNPILIFSETSVWYPLMERDDTKVDESLRKVVDKYSTGKNVPALEDEEKEILEYLKAATRLDSYEQLRLAELVAAHTQMARIGNIIYDEYRSRWAELKIPIVGGRGLFYTIYRVANYLSPITARLATISNSSDGKIRMTAMSNEYTKHTATKFYKSGNLSWGYSWPCGLVGNIIDETYRTKGSHCVWQAINLASVADAMNLDVYILELYQSSNGMVNTSVWHTTVYLPQYDLVLGNGVVETIVYKRPNTVVNYVKTGIPRTVLRFLSHGEKWAVPVLSKNETLMYYYGIMPPGELSEELKKLTSIHGDQFEGFLIDVDKAYAVSFQDFLEALKILQNRFKPVKLP